MRHWFLAPLIVYSLLGSMHAADIWGNTRCGSHQKCPFGLNLHAGVMSPAWGVSHGIPSGGIQALFADRALVYEGTFSLAWQWRYSGDKFEDVTRPHDKGNILRSKPALSRDQAVLFVAEGPWAGSSSDVLHAVNMNDGRDLWHYSSEAALHEPPLVIGGQPEIVVVGQRKLPWNIVALNAFDGSTLWSKQGNATTCDRNAGHASSPVALPDHAMIVFATMCHGGSSAGELRALLAADGSLRWSASDPDLKPIVGFFGDPDVTISPDGAAGFLWSRAENAAEVMLYAFSMDDGRKLWSATAPAPPPLPGGIAQRPLAPVVSWDGEKVFIFTVEKGVLVARDVTVAAGNPVVWVLWRSDGRQHVSGNVAPVISSDGKAVFFATDADVDHDHGLVCGLNVEDGISLGKCMNMNKQVITDLFAPTTTTTTTTATPMRVVLHNKDFCLDLPAGNALNGQPLWLWDCIGPDEWADSAGLHQQWIFNIGTGQLQYAPDPSFCVDIPGGDVSVSTNTLWLWECAYTEDGGPIFGQSFKYTNAGEPISLNARDDICLSYDYTGSAEFVDVRNCSEVHGGGWDITKFSNPLSGVSDADAPVV